MITRKEKDFSVKEWMDAFFVAVEAAVSEMADNKKLAKKLQRDVDYVPSVSIEDFHKRQTIWKSIQRKMGNFGDGVSPKLLAFYGLEKNGPSYIATGNEVRFYIEGDSSYIAFRGDEIPVIINFISFYRALCYKLNPGSFVREVLEREGITKDNFAVHPKSPGNLIQNPFKEDDHAS